MAEKSTYVDSTEKLKLFKVVKGVPESDYVKENNGSNMCTVSAELAKTCPVGTILDVNCNKYLVVGVDKSSDKSVTVYVNNNTAYESITKHWSDTQKTEGFSNMYLTGYTTAPTPEELGLTKKNLDVNTSTGGTNSIQAHVTAAGVDGTQLDDASIMDFAKFLEQMSLRANMDKSFNAQGTTTVHEYVSRNMQRYYHQLYYIPNLKNNYAIIVKPETLFIYAPSCNIIYPNIKNSLTFTRNIKSEPTRIIQISDPMAGLGAASSTGLMNLTCVLLVDEEPLKDSTGKQLDKNGLPLYKQYVVSSKDFSSLVSKKANPMTAISAYEKRNGIHGVRVQQGGNTYLFLTSKGSGKVNNAYSIGSTKEEQTSIGTAMAKLARYELIRQRYQMRNGSITMYFNPYIVPGFPFVSVESNTGGCNVYGYVTAVAHNFTAGNWTTSINFNCAHMDNEQTPLAFPIIESEYTSGLANTYKDMLGDTVKPVNNADIPNLISSYYNGKKKLSTSLRKIWRPTTSFDQYLTEIADGATLVQEKGFYSIKNGAGSNFFDETVQASIRAYSEQIMVNKLPFTNDDVR